MTRSVPDRAVVDTNVLVVANSASSQAAPECEQAAIDFLEACIGSSVIILDSTFEIFDEYKRYCSFKGQPGIGDRFFLHLHRTQADPRYVQFVDIHPLEGGSYHEVPQSLRDFDPADHKFIAAVVADDYNAVIVNCVDSDWSNASIQLRAEHIDVAELCGLGQDTDVR